LLKVGTVDFQKISALHPVGFASFEYGLRVSFDRATNRLQAGRTSRPTSIGATAISPVAIHPLRPRVINSGMTAQRPPQTKRSAARAPTQQIKQPDAGQTSRELIE